MGSADDRPHRRLGLLAAAAVPLAFIWVVGDDPWPYGEVFIALAVALALAAGWLAGGWSVVVLLVSAVLTNAVFTTIDWSNWGGCIEPGSTCEASALERLIPGLPAVLTVLLFVPCVLLAMLARRLTARRRQEQAPGSVTE